MFKKSIFGAIKTTDGYHIQSLGKNIVRLKRNRKYYFVFFEYLHAKPLSVQVDQSGVWTDEKLKRRLDDRELEQEIIQRVIGYFQFRGITVAS